MSLNKKMIFYKSFYFSKLIGKLILISDGNYLTGLWIEGKKNEKNNNNHIFIEKELPIFEKAKKWLDKYFNGEKPNINDISIRFIGSEFRQKVWRELINIPYGKTITYGELAKKIFDENNSSSQAIGGAVGHNPIGIIVPCHRVIGANNKLTGYGGGLLNKVKLLKYEGVDVKNLH